VLEMTIVSSVTWNGSASRLRGSVSASTRPAARAASRTLPRPLSSAFVNSGGTQP
jgi:hypothetical protein